MADAVERNAETQNLYREVNERVAEVYAQFSGSATPETTLELIELFCECGHEAPCDERINVSSATYERVRSDPTTFILLPGHGKPAVEHVIEQGDDFLIARNFGRAAEIARAADPRRVMRVEPGSDQAA
jgi:hypothetical protein